MRRRLETRVTTSSLRPRVVLRAAVTVTTMLVGTATTNAAPVPAQLTSCGTIQAAGKSWGITAVNVPCNRAVSLVHKLATRTVPAHLRYPGTYAPSRLRCVGRPTSGSTPTRLACAGRNHTLVLAGVKVR
jgi:hypothetical protein